MPSFVIDEKCDGCKGGDKTACMYICPNDLMVLDADRMKAYNCEPDMCWECYNCVKICPTQAIEVRGYADFTPLGASVVPMRGSEDIMWTVKFRGDDQAVQIPHQDHDGRRGQTGRRLRHRTGHAGRSAPVYGTGIVESR